MTSKGTTVAGSGAPYLVELGLVPRHLSHRRLAGERPKPQTPKVLHQSLHAITLRPAECPLPGRSVPVPDDLMTGKHVLVPAASITQRAVKGTSH